MENKIVWKPSHIETPNMWGVFNMSSRDAVSRNGYFLAITQRPYDNLDDLTPAEESAFWRFNASAINSALMDDDFFRNQNESDYDVGSCSSVMCVVSDGRHAGQSVYHSHAHIIGMPSLYDGLDISQMLDSSRRELRPGARPVATHTVELNAYFAENIRAARKDMADRYCPGASRNDYSFSIYTRNPVQKSDTPVMAVELWTKYNPAPAGPSGFIKYWNGFKDIPSKPNDPRFNRFEKTRTPGIN